MQTAGAAWRGGCRSLRRGRGNGVRLGPRVVDQRGRRRASRRQAGIHKISHVIVIMQENRSFDEYFGTYPGANGYPTQQRSLHACVSTTRPPVSACTRITTPTPSTAAARTGRSTRSPTSTAARWTASSRAPRRAARAAARRTTPTCGGGGSDTMGYHDARDIPNYWTWAHDFVLQDAMFEPNASWSLPAHLFEVSEWSANCHGSSDPQNCVNALQSPGNPPDFNKKTGHDVDAADLRLDRPHLPPPQGQRVVELLRAGRPATGLRRRRDGLQRARTRTPRPRASGTRCRTSRPCSRTVSSATSRTSPTTSRRPRTGTLPAVSWVAPAQQDSDHPPANIEAGQTWVTRLINAAMQGPDWNSTAIFLTWDDWGGFYDHVVPPTRRRQRLRAARARAGDQPVRPAGVRRPPDPQLRRLRQVHRGRLPRRPAARPADRRPARPAARRPRERARSSATWSPTSTSASRRARPRRSPRTRQPGPASSPGG